VAQLKDRYAAALIEISEESGQLGEYLEQVKAVYDALNRDECVQFLQHPHIPSAAKKQLFTSLFDGKISADIMGFLFLSVDKNRETLLIPALSAYIDMANKKLGRLEANVVSAAALSKQQLSRLQSVLTAKLQKQVEVKHSVDPGLIGGLYIHVDGRLIDCSIRTQLKRLRESMEGGVAT